MHNQISCLKTVNLGRIALSFLKWEKSWRFFYSIYFRKMLGNEFKGSDLTVIGASKTFKVSMEKLKQNDKTEISTEL